MVHVDPLGAPLQVSAVAALNPLIGVMLRVVIVLLPCVTVLDAGETAVVKSGNGGAAIVMLRLEDVDAAKPVAPA